MALSTLNGVTVLVVEDSWHVARAIKCVLELFGMQVIGPTATTTEARQLTAAHEPKLALVDVNLKQETSHDLICELHKQGILVVVVSGYASVSVAPETIAGYLQKPFNGPELINVIGSVVDRLQ